MAAVSTLVDRIYRDFLNKPDDLSAFSRLDGAINDSVTSLNYEAGLFSVEEENLLGSGALIEIGQEIMLVTSATTSTRTLTVSRGYAGTSAAAHSDNDNIFVNPGSSTLTFTSVINSETGDVDTQNFPFNIVCVQTCSQLGDANCDNIVNLSDLTLVLNNWLQSTSAGQNGDVVGSLDGLVNLSDLTLVLNNWLQSTP